VQNSKITQTITINSEILSKSFLLKDSNSKYLLIHIKVVFIQNKFFRFWQAEFVPSIEGDSVFMGVKKDSKIILKVDNFWPHYINLSFFLTFSTKFLTQIHRLNVSAHALPLPKAVLKFSHFILHVQPSNSCSMLLPFILWAQNDS